MSSTPPTCNHDHSQSQSFFAGPPKLLHHEHIKQLEATYNEVCTNLRRMPTTLPKKRKQRLRATARAFIPFIPLKKPDLIQPRDHQVLKLDSIEKLLHDDVEPGMYIVLDIDETILTCVHQPCRMMSEKGLQQLQATLSKIKHLNSDGKNAIMKHIQIALGRKRLVESITGDVIRQLQTRSCHVFALTARYSNMIGATMRELQSLGIDLSLTSPFPSNKRLVHSASEALCQDGIIFRNANEKGPILDQFLSSILVHGGADGHSNVPIPKRIVFVDDLHANAQSVLTHTQMMKRLNIQVTAYHYEQHQPTDDIFASISDDSFNNFQILHFLDTKHILNDHQARHMWSQTQQLMSCCCVQQSA